MTPPYQPPNAPTAGPGLRPPAGDSAKILLLVEDEPLIALAEQMVLKRAGYGVIVAGSGERAVELVQNGTRVDLILMDVDLGSGIDGPQAASIILQAHDLPLVFLSSHTEPEVVEKTERITSYGYIVKNSGETVLLASIRMAFRLFESRSFANETFTHSINGLCVHRLLYDDQGRPYDCRYLQVNAAFERHTGFAAEQVVGRTIRETFPASDVGGLIDLYAPVVLQRHQLRHELFFEPIGQWFEISAFAIAGDDFVVVINNSTVRKHAQQSLERSEKLYRILLENSVDGIKLMNRNGKILQANAAAAAMLGYTRAELQALSIPEIDPFYPQDKFRAFWTAQPDELPARVETFQRHRDGRLIPVEVSAIPFELDGDQLVFGISRDISTTVSQVEALRAGQAQFRALFLNAPDAMFIADAESGVIVDANRSAERLIGRPAAEIIGRHHGTLHPPAFAELSTETFDEHRRQSDDQAPVHPIAADVLRADGTVVPVEVTASRVTYRGRNCLMGVFRVRAPRP